MRVVPPPKEEDRVTMPIWLRSGQLSPERLGLSQGEARGVWNSASSQVGTAVGFSINPGGSSKLRSRRSPSVNGAPAVALGARAALRLSATGCEPASVAICPPSA